MRLPSSNGVSFPYGATTPPYSTTNPHAGTDYKFRPDNYWYAPEKVKVTSVGSSVSCGKQIDFESLDGKRKYRGCHNETLYAAQGNTYDEGFKMGKMGATGNALGAHLHLVMWVNGVRVDPDATIKSLIGEPMNYPNAGDVQNVGDQNHQWNQDANGVSYPDAITYWTTPVHPKWGNPNDVWVDMVNEVGKHNEKWANEHQPTPPPTNFKPAPQLFVEDK